MLLPKCRSTNMPTSRHDLPKPTASKHSLATVKTQEVGTAGGWHCSPAVVTSISWHSLLLLGSRNRTWIKAATWVLAGLVHDVQARRWKGESRRGKQIIVMIYQLSALTSVLGECTDKVVSYSKRSWLFLRPPISTFAPRAPVGPSVSVPARD